MRTNLIIQSEDFSTWDKVDSIVVNDALSPIGTLTADKVIEATANNNFFTVVVSETVAIGSNYTDSMYLKLTGSNEGNATCRLLLSRGAGGDFEETTKILTLTADWVRYDVSRIFVQKNIDELKIFPRLYSCDFQRVIIQKNHSSLF